MIKRPSRSNFIRGETPISHVAVYASWLHAFSAMPVAKGVFDAQAK